MAKKLVFDDDGLAADQTVEDNELRVNESYAQRYEHRKQREELERLTEKYGDISGITQGKLSKIAAKQAKYGRSESAVQRMIAFAAQTGSDEEFDLDGSDEDEEEDDSEEESEDEVGEQVTPAHDVQIMKTIALIRAKDPSIYDKQKSLFTEEALAKAGEGWTRKGQQQSKDGNGVDKMTLKDYHRKRLLEGGADEDEDNSGSGNDGGNQVDFNRPATYVEEQAALKRALRDAATMDEEKDEDDDFFEERPRTADEIAQDEQEYREFLMSSMRSEPTTAAAFKGIVESDEVAAEKTVSADDKFLMDYVLNRGWLEKNDKHRIPTYSEIIDEIASEDEMENAAEYESTYNHRFEEAGEEAAHILTYARNIESSMRRKDTSRADKRKAVAERKSAEKEQRLQEMRRLRNLKKMHVMEKLREIREITGNDSIGVDDIDLEGDFDPEKFDQQMDLVFEKMAANEEKEQQQDDDGDDDDDDNDASDSEGDGDKKTKTKNKRKQQKMKKPTWDDDIDISDIVGVDDDEKPSEELSGRQRKKQRIADTKALKKSVEEYVDEHFQLDYEDVIAGGEVATRFHYRQVEPETFGLSAAEILDLDDDDLNQFASLKKLAPYRPKEKLERDRRKLSKKRRLKEFRAKIAAKQQERQQQKASNDIGYEQRDDDYDDNGNGEVQVNIIESRNASKPSSRRSR
ncbi:Krr1-domain-containing protein [Ramicandelaber brevisporus]|nr:Krr1-domain-containing protein [Ramicandelaber brevisporus]